jgi:hypothetical protein
MAVNDDIRQALKGITQTDDVIYSVLCTVATVDTTTNTCDCEPIDESADLLGVKLIAQSANGFLIIPKVDSVVLVTMINKYTGYVSMFSEVDEIHLNGKNFKGLVKIEDLIEKLNNLETAFNNHLTAYNLHTHIGVTVGIGATGITTPDTNTLTPTIISDLENTTVQHGDGN